MNTGITSSRGAADVGLGLCALVELSDEDLPFLRLSPTWRKTATPAFLRRAAGQPGSLQRLEAALVDSILQFLYTPCVDLQSTSPRRILQPGDQDYALLRARRADFKGAFNTASWKIIEGLKYFGTTELLAGLYLELEGLNRLIAHGQANDTLAQAASAATASLGIFERASIETFDRHFLIEDTCRSFSDGTWESAKTEFWCVAWLRHRKEELQGNREAIFRARVVFCKVQCSCQEPFGEFVAPAVAHEFELVLLGEGSVRLVGFDAGRVLTSTCKGMSRSIPGMPGLRRSGLLH